MPCSLASTRNFVSWGGLFYRLRHDLRCSYHFSDINWGLGHFSKFIFIWFYTLFLMENFMRNPKMLSKMQVFEGNTYFLKIFDVIYIFLILSIMSCGDHVLWELTILSQWKIVKLCSNQLESLFLILNNSKGRILKKTL